MPYSSYGVHAVSNIVRTFADDDTGNWVPIGGFGPPLTMLLSCVAANSDAVSHVVQVAAYPDADPEQFAIIGSAVVPAGAGFDGSPVVDLLAAVRPVPSGVFLAYNDCFAVRVPVQPDTGTVVTVYAAVGAF